MVTLTIEDREKFEKLRQLAAYAWKVIKETFQHVVSIIRKLCYALIRVGPNHMQIRSFAGKRGGGRRTVRRLTRREPRHG